MPTWRCPHCGAPQPESARCWVCRRSTTCCSTCRWFRRAVAGQLGYCGLDRRRAPLTGDEIRGCWQGAAEARVTDLAGASPATARSRGPARRPRIDFVPVDELREPGSQAAAAPNPATPPDATSPLLRFILWEELEG